MTATSDPFRVRCKSCNTVAESWHWSSSLPTGKTSGPASCQCGMIEADSVGVAGKGRIVTDAPPEQWEVLDQPA
jgi:hypothetical protein